MKPNFATLHLLLFSAGHLVAESREPDWVGPMKQVHERFTGDAGTFAQFGDSITNSRAFWSSLRYERDNAPPEMFKAFGLVKERMIEDCWDGKGAKNGNEGRMTIRWAHQNVSQWLVTLNPEVAIVMFGTNDLTSVPAKEYEQKMREVVQRCLDNGTFVILSTIPPRHRFEEKSAQYADIVRSIADELKVPLIDYHAEILHRRPDDWDGALGKFQEYQGYDVPTLIARDGVHPSAPKKYRGDYSMESLSRNGFALRNYLTVRLGNQTATWIMIYVWMASGDKRICGRPYRKECALARVSGSGRDLRRLRGRFAVPGRVPMDKARLSI